MQTKLTVPIAAPNLDQARQQTEAAIAAGAEMLELRTDYLENLSVELVKSVIAEAKKSVRLTIRFFTPKTQVLQSNGSSTALRQFPPFFG